MTDIAKPSDWSNTGDVFDWVSSHGDFGLSDVYVGQGSLKGGVEMVKAISMEQAYEFWGHGPAGHGHTPSGNELIVRCVSGQHADNNPSMCMNLQKGVFVCYSCDWRGDVIEMAARYYGYSNYKEDPDEFIDLLENMLVQIGVDPNELRRQNAEAGQTTEIEISSAVPVDDGIPIVREDYQTDEDRRREQTEEEVDNADDLDWRTMLARPEYKGTFLERWMHAMHPLQAPNEFILWAGLAGASLAAGRRVYYNFAGRRTHTNMQICLTGVSGSGKSDTTDRLTRMIREVFTDDNGAQLDEENPVRVHGAPASGPALFNFFKTYDYETGDSRPPATVLLDVDEFAAFMAASTAKGANIIQYFQGFADGRVEVTHDSVTTGAKIAREGFMTTLTNTQPDAIGTFVSAKDSVNGFANRWIFVGGTPKPLIGLRELNRLRPDLSDAKAQMIRLRARSLDYGKRGGLEISETEEAAEIYDEWRELWLERASGPNGLMFKRFPHNCLRVAILLAFIQGREEIDGPTMTDAAKLMEANAAQTLETGDAITINQDQWYSRQVMDICRDHKAETGEWPTKSEIGKAFSSSKRDPVKIGAAISYLDRNQSLELVHGRKPDGSVDKRTRRWKLVD